MSGLVEVHEVHIDAAPRQFDAELGMQVQQRLLKRLQSADAHLRRRVCVHPGDHPDALWTVVGLPDHRGDVVGCDNRWYPDDLDRYLTATVELLCQLPR